MTTDAAGAGAGKVEGCVALMMTMMGEEAGQAATWTSRFQECPMPVVMLMMMLTMTHLEPEGSCKRTCDRPVVQVLSLLTMMMTLCLAITKTSAQEQAPLAQSEPGMQTLNGTLEVADAGVVETCDVVAAPGDAVDAFHILHLALMEPWMVGVGVGTAAVGHWSIVNHSYMKQEGSLTAADRN